MRVRLHTRSHTQKRDQNTGSKRELRVQNGIRLLQVMLQLRINNLDIIQSS